MCFNLKLQSHVQVQEHEADTDEEGEGAPGVVGHIEE